MGLVLISFASALSYNITAGESISFMIPENFDHYSIVGNQSEVDLNITQDGLNITIIIGKYSESDSFEVNFLNKEKEVIHHYIGGGGSRTRYVDRNVTVEVPRFYDRNITVTKKVLVDKIVNTVTEVDNGFKLWHILLGIAVGLGFGLFIVLRLKKHKPGEKK